MSAPLEAGPFRIELTLYTTEGSSYRPVQWTHAARTRVCEQWVSGDGGEQRWAPGAQVSVTLEEFGDEYVGLRVCCRHSSPIKAVKLALDLPAMKMLAPECVELAEGVVRQWDFPRDWRAGFAVWQSGERFFVVSTQDFPWRFRRLRALRTADGMRLEIVQDAALRERSCNFETSVWKLGFVDEIDDLLDEHAAFVQQAHGALEFKQRRDVPDWARRVGLVVNLHGTDWNGRTHLDFAGMTCAAETLAPLFPAEQTLLYFIGWDGRYMRDYPDYRPSAGLGGPEGLNAFCERARALGFHLMPHLNAMAANMRHPLYLEHLQNYVLRDANGVEQRSFKIDWDHDGLGDAAQAYISLTPPALREILVGVIDRLVETFGFDGVFLDETCNVFYNDPAWDPVEGVRRLVRDIRARHADLLIVGEEWNEMLLGLTPWVQVWEETADGRKGFGYEKSPLTRRWVGRFIRASGYLALASPDGSTGVHEWPARPWVDERENEAYYVPTLSITKRTLEEGMPGIRATVERARDYVKCFVGR